MVDKYYNLHFYEEDRKDPSYRHMFVIAKDDDRVQLRKIEKEFAKHPPASPEDLSYKLQLFGLLFALFDLGAKRELSEVKRNNLALNEMLRAKDIHIENLEASLEEMQELQGELQHLVEGQKAKITELGEMLASKEMRIRDLELLAGRIEHSSLYRIWNLLRLRRAKASRLRRESGQRNTEDWKIED